MFLDYEIKGITFTEQVLLKLRDAVCDEHPEELKTLLLMHVPNDQK